MESGPMGLPDRRSGIGQSCISGVCLVDPNELLKNLGCLLQTTTIKSLGIASIDPTTTPLGPPGLWNLTVE